jgi:methanethiol S-methyltransferase
MIPILLTMLIFGVIHSLLAESGVKQAFQNRFGAYAYHGFYRLLYNLFTIVTLLPVVFIMLSSPGHIIWQVDGPLAWVLRVIQLIGLIGLSISLLQIDLGQFLGLKQLRAYLRQQPLPLPLEPLQTNGLYSLVRHPLYLFSLMLIWPLQTTTESLLAFNIAATLYFVLGSLLEERRLLALFGQDYADYQQRVPWLIPLPFKR